MTQNMDFAGVMVSKLKTSTLQILFIYSEFYIADLELRVVVNMKLSNRLSYYGL